MDDKKKTSEAQSATGTVPPKEESPKKANDTKSEAGTPPPPPPKDTQLSQSTASTTPPQPKDTPTPPPTPPATPPSNTPTPKTEPKPGGPSAPPPPQDTTPPKNSTPSAPPPHQDHKALPKWILALIILFVVALLGIGGYAVYANMTAGPSPTPTPPQAQAPTPIPTQATEQVVLNDELSLSYTIPDNWTQNSNVTTEEVTKEYGNGFSTPNEYATNENGCSVYFGDLAGSGGPTQVLDNEEVAIGGATYTKRSWYRETFNETPFFIYFFPTDTTSENPSIWAWVPEDENALLCNQQIQEVLSSVEFTEPASILPISPGTSTPSGEVTQCTLDAKVCPDGSTVGRQGPNCEFAPCPPLTNQ